MIDFGIAGVCETGRVDKLDAGSLCYMSPECLMGKAIESSPSIDVWAIGIMFYSLLYGTLPFYADDEDTTIKLIKTAPIKFSKDIAVTPMAREIITRMLDRDPEKRLDLMDLMDMDFFKHDDDIYLEMFDKYKEEHTKMKEEQKTQQEEKSSYRPNAVSPRAHQKGVSPGVGGRGVKLGGGYQKDSIASPGLRNAGNASANPKPKKTPITKM